MSVANELLPILNQLSKMSKPQLEAIGLTMEELLTVEILTDPIKWAKEYLGWESRDYQDLILEQGAKRNRLVLRLGRRLGKTECMCILILWHAFTQINVDPTKADTDPYDILILTPYEKQAELIYDRLVELIEASSEFKGSIKRKVFLRLELHNNTCIQLMTVGSGSGSGAANTRGQRADLIVYDEVDYIGEDEITNTYNIRNEDPTRIKILAASTPSGDRRSFYNWCVNASHQYHSDNDHIMSTGEIKYSYENRPGKKGNGWTEVYAPSTVNKKLHLISPDTGMTGLEELREEFSEMRYLQEVMAEFGESLDGVYQKKFIDNALHLGEQLKVEYTSDLKGVQMRDFPRVGPRILGIDWDKKGAATNMVGVQFVQEIGKFVPFVRVEIPRHEFTYAKAVQMIIKLNDVYNFDWIYADAGHGEYQIEDLKIYGMKNPASGLQHKIVRVNFSEKVTVRDPFTMKKEQKHIKPFMVNNLVIAFERGQVALNPNDKDTLKQFQDYKIERWGADGRPVYTSENEHIHDCVMLAMHGFISKYSDMLKVNTTVKVAKLKPLELGGEEEIKERDLPEKKESNTAVFAGLSLIGSSGRKDMSRSGRRSMGMPRRNHF